MRWLKLCFLLIPLHAENTIGCSTATKLEIECSQESPLTINESSQPLPLEFEENQVRQATLKTINITKELQTLTLQYQNKEFNISREPHTPEQSCPPYCIQPIAIDNVKTVGELETLKFIATLDNNEGTLLIDARVPSMHKHQTLPAAINIPYTMLEKTNKYHESVLTLLGAKKAKKNWDFKNVRKLLIFDTALWDFQAYTLIKALIKLGYPQNHLLYYRGGILGWKTAGLSLY